jgi:hypothetical protein
MDQTLEILDAIDCASRERFRFKKYTSRKLYRTAILCKDSESVYDFIKVATEQSRFKYSPNFTEHWEIEEFSDGEHFEDIRITKYLLKSIGNDWAIELLLDKGSGDRGAISPMLAIWLEEFGNFSLVFHAFNTIALDQDLQERVLYGTHAKWERKGETTEFLKINDHMPMIAMRQLKVLRETGPTFVGEQGPTPITPDNRATLEWPK